MLYAMSDIHGQYELFANRVKQIRPLLQDNEGKLILLGDYIDRGNKSFECLRLAFQLEQDFGKENVIVLKGNHEVWFEEFLFQNEDVWLVEDKDFLTSKTFLTKDQFEKLHALSNRGERIKYLKTCIKENHKELLSWMRKLRLFYETDTQIFVHAGVEEELPEEEVEWCTFGTPDYVMTGKFPPAIGRFYKDIIAGHVSVSSLARDKHFRDIFFDGKSHYYIDGTSETIGKILCLAFDENSHKYYQLEENGERKGIKPFLQC